MKTIESIGALKMARIPGRNQGRQLRRESPQRQPRDRYVFRLSWLLVPLCILGMWYLLSRIEPTVTWEAIINLLKVNNRERYSALAILCVSLTLVVTAIRIIGRKDDK
jgi:hypothetical protein